MKNSLLDLPWYQHDLVQTDGGVQRDMWLIFCNSDNGFFMNKWMKDGYQHVAMMTNDGYSFNYNSRNMQFNISIPLPVDKSDLQGAKDFLSNMDAKTSDYTFVRVRNVIDLDVERRVKFPVTPDTCVEDIKAHLGIRDYWILTPYQLYTYCRDNNLIVEE